MRRINGRLLVVSLTVVTAALCGCGKSNAPAGNAKTTASKQKSDAKDSKAAKASKEAPVAADKNRTPSKKG